MYGRMTGWMDESIHPSMIDRSIHWSIHRSIHDPPIHPCSKMGTACCHEKPKSTTAFKQKKNPSCVGEFGLSELSCLVRRSRMCQRAAPKRTHQKTTTQTQFDNPFAYCDIKFRSKTIPLIYMLIVSHIVVLFLLNYWLSSLCLLCFGLQDLIPKA